ncbi:MAG TPA: hypothetical protein ENN42_08090 [Thioalkalivibrio sp.]|nr:hypothetical protein [Thioalkalivibrio sp.]
MTGPATPRQPANVVAGPGVGRWHCPCCGEDVSRLLPNGMLNRHPLCPADIWLPHPDIETAARELGAHPDHDVCLGCRDTLRQLLGTLLVPAEERATPLESRGRVDTGLIGAVVPGLSHETLILVFDADDSRLGIAEAIPLSQFDPRRMTYPDERGAIAVAVWAVYQRVLEQVRAETP